VNGGHGQASASGTAADDPGPPADSRSADEPSETATDARSADDQDGTEADRSGNRGTPGTGGTGDDADPDRGRTNGDGVAGFSAAAVLDRLNAVSETPVTDDRRSRATEGTARPGSTRRPADRQPAPAPGSGSGSGAGPPSGGDGQPTPGSGASTGHTGDGEASGNAAADGSTDGTPEADIVEADGDDSEYGIMRDRGEEPPIIEDEEPLVVRELKADIAGFDTRTRKMLSFYREFGPGTPLNAHFAAGGDDDRTEAYARNRTLRSYGLIEHAGRGHYDYRLRDYLAEHVQGDVSAGRIDAYARNVEENALGVADGE
jgi:hypothetical protein